MDCSSTLGLMISSGVRSLGTPSQLSARSMASVAFLKWKQFNRSSAKTFQDHDELSLFAISMQKSLQCAISSDVLIEGAKHRLSSKAGFYLTS